MVLICGRRTSSRTTSVGRICIPESLNTYVHRTWITCVLQAHCSSTSQNIRTIAQYYTRIRLSHLTTLLDLTLPQTEEILCRLVVSGTIWARVDRPAGIVSFRQSRTAEDVMNDWSSDMSKLLSLVEKTWMGVNAAQAAQARAKAVAAASS